VDAKAGMDKVRKIQLPTLVRNRTLINQPIQNHFSDNLPGSVTVKLFLRLIKHHAMEIYLMGGGGEGRGQLPSIINLDTRWRRVVTLS
jgi:hypothetical protein